MTHTFCRLRRYAKWKEAIKKEQDQNYYKKAIQASLYYSLLKKALGMIFQRNQNSYIKPLHALILLESINTR